VVIAPVVGFDQQGYRLGYGGAFYDQTVAAVTKSRAPSGSATAKPPSRRSIRFATTLRWM
jgi:5-formyltetrahydrofolate cyclo-ligase